MQAKFGTHFYGFTLTESAFTDPDIFMEWLTARISDLIVTQFHIAQKVSVNKSKPFGLLPSCQFYFLFCKSDFEQLDFLSIQLTAF